MVLWPLSKDLVGASLPGTVTFMDLPGLVTFNLAVHSIGRCLRRFAGRSGLRILLNLFALLRSRTLVLGGERSISQNERNSTDGRKYCLHSCLFE